MGALTKEVSNKAPSSRSAKGSNDVSPSARSTPWQALHQTLGNQGVQRLLRAGVIQAKLEVSQPGDNLEQEADRVAEQVLRMPQAELPDTPEARKSAGLRLSRYSSGSSAHSSPEVRALAMSKAAPSATAKPLQTAGANLTLQRKCACDAGASSLTGECAECNEKKLGLQTKLRINEPGDVYEQEADRVAEQVLAKPAHPDVSSAPPRIQRYAGQATGQADTAPASVDHVLAVSGRPLEPALREDMEQRFGYNFSRVRVHSGAAAEQSARDVNAHAYTAGHNIVFGAGLFVPGTHEGRRLIAHELAHVVQQSGLEGIRRGQSNKKYGPSPDIPLSASKSGVVQRQPAGRTEAAYQRLVRQGKWCRDSEESGKLHPGLQCYRKIPPLRDYPPGDQVCFDKKSGKFAEESPDVISPVSGQKKDGTCDIPVKITDPPHPFTQRGRRGLGHAIADIGTGDPDIVGRWFGRISGVAMGIALPKGIDSDLARWAIPSILGFVAGELGERGLPRLNRLAQKHGFLPTISLGFGSNVGLGVGVGLEKRDRPLSRVPVNTYLTLSLDSSLAVADGPGASSTFLAKVGVRIDPGKQGGLFALGSVGAGLAAGSDVSGAMSAELGAGIRATDFLDVQLVRETVSGGGGSDTTYWLTLKLVAPQRIFKRHR